MLRLRATRGSRGEALPDELIATRSFLPTLKDIANIGRKVAEKALAGLSDWDAALAFLGELAAKGLAVWELVQEADEAGEEPTYRLRAALFSGYLDQFVSDYGKNTVAMDTTFNTNSYGFKVLGLMTFNHWGMGENQTLLNFDSTELRLLSEVSPAKIAHPAALTSPDVTAPFLNPGVPLGFFVIANETEEDIVWCLERMKERYKASFNPKAFVVDKSRAERNAIERAFPDKKDKMRAPFSFERDVLNRWRRTKTMQLAFLSASV